MIQAQYSDQSHIVDILVKAFDTNKSVNYVVKQDKKRVQRIRILMEYSFDTCWMFGDVFLSNDKKGAVLLLYPERKKTNLKAIFNDIKLILGSIGIFRIAKIIKRESVLQKHYPEHYIYLWFVGVEPSYQGQGIGSSLIKEAFELSKERGLPVLLETSNDKNLSLYNRMGFEQYQIVDLSYKIYMYRKYYLKYTNMPLVRIDIASGRKKEFLKSLMTYTIDCVIDILKLPADDKNIRVIEYDPDLFKMKPPYNMIIEISLFSGRTIETKRKLYQVLTSVLSEKLGIKKEEIFILLNEQPKENWGVRGGIAASDIDLGFKVEV